MDEARRQRQRLLLRFTRPVDLLLMGGVLAIGLSGLIYIWLFDWAVAAERFVLLLLLAAIVLCCGTLYTKWRIGWITLGLMRDDLHHGSEGKRKLLAFGDDGVSEPQLLLLGIFNLRLMVVTGLLYGAMFASFPLLFQLKLDPAQLVVLSLFLFCVNFVTGSVIYSLVRLMIEGWHFADRVVISIFAKQTPTSAAYSAVLRSVTLISALHIVLALASVRFSPFSTGSLYLFGFYSIFLLLAIYYLPQLPLRLRLRDEKLETLKRIGEQQQALLLQPLTPQVLSHLEKLQATGDQVRNLTTTLSKSDSSWVKWSATLTGLLPLIRGFMEKLVEFTHGVPLIGPLMEKLAIYLKAVLPLLD